jgi:hypothetical protein
VNLKDLTLSRLFCYQALRIVERAVLPTALVLYVESVEEEADGKKKTSEELRALWRKAILETLLLIRMEKENIDLQGEDCVHPLSCSI